MFTAHPSPHGHFLWSFPAHLQGVRLWVSAEHPGDSRSRNKHWKNHNCAERAKFWTTVERKQKKIKAMQMMEGDFCNWSSWIDSDLARSQAQQSQGTSVQTVVMRQFGPKHTRPWHVNSFSLPSEGGASQQWWETKGEKILHVWWCSYGENWI